jgi:hypothetical protein
VLTELLLVGGHESEESLLAHVGQRRVPELPHVVERQHSPALRARLELPVTQDSLPVAGQALPGGLALPRGPSVRFLPVASSLPRLCLAQRKASSLETAFTFGLRLCYSPPQLFLRQYSMISFHKVLFFMMFGLLAACPRQTPEPQIPTRQVSPEILLIQGDNLSEKEVAELEAQLTVEPFELDIRIKLLGFYWLRAIRIPDYRVARQRHILWIIENAPKSTVARHPAFRLEPKDDGEAYVQAKSLWQHHIETHPGDLLIIGNAAAFFLLSDKEDARVLLEKAKKLEPNNPYWSEQLALLYSIAQKNNTNNNEQQEACKALVELQKAYEMTSMEASKFAKLPDLARVAYIAGEWDKAKTYAEMMLKQAPSFKEMWPYGNGVHYGNVILGRLALRAGDINSAKGYLLSAALVPGSPQLGSFGPDITLAKELLEAGEIDSVIIYFEQCSTFWKMGKERLQKWVQILKSGGSPDFRGETLDVVRNENGCSSFSSIAF